MTVSATPEMQQVSGKPRAFIPEYLSPPYPALPVFLAPICPNLSKQGRFDAYFCYRLCQAFIRRFFFM
jgi:hypothetical protein